MWFVFSEQADCTGDVVPTVWMYSTLEKDVLATFSSFFSGKTVNIAAAGWSRRWQHNFNIFICPYIEKVMSINVSLKNSK